MTLSSFIACYKEDKASVVHTGHPSNFFLCLDCHVFDYVLVNNLLLTCLLIKKIASGGY